MATLVHARPISEEGPVPGPLVADPPPVYSAPKGTLWRNLAAFWAFGLCNNFAYVIMLSAAHDILAEQRNETAEAKDDHCNASSNVSATHRDCNPISTGAVLLADIIPTLVVKLSAPFFMQRFPYGSRTLFVILCQVASYLIVSFSNTVAVSLLGVVFASIGAGLGEITFLSLAAHFDRNVISTWSSGTGGAGVFGALAYAGLTEPNFANLSPQVAVLVMLVVPAIMTASYWLLMVVPTTVHQVVSLNTCIVPSDSSGGQLAKTVSTVPSEDSDSDWDERDTLLPTENSTNNLIEQKVLTMKDKLVLIVPLLKYMIPLGCVYMAEYFINQGLQELVYFNICWLSRDSQYRWYQVLYQVGVFISRSSVNIVQIPSAVLPVLAVLQFLNASLFFCEAYWLFIPSIWIAFAVIVFEGLLGGAAYVNTFYQIREKTDPRYVEYSLGVASVADSSGIVIAGFLSMPAHNWICKQPLPANHY